VGRAGEGCGVPDDPAVPGRCALRQQPAAAAAGGAVKRLAALTVLFSLLNYVGAALYGHTEGVTTIKPYSGVALALILILGRGWRSSLLAAGLAAGGTARHLM